jgi:hypothetical protein
VSCILNGFLFNSMTEYSETSPVGRRVEAGGPGGPRILQCKVSLGLALPPNFTPLVQGLTACTV